ncbi:hypothetical protein EP331_13050 [bacterium]|nr:MAG: hypothetical protein EP331_13050 [bacterium]
MDIGVLDVNKHRLGKRYVSVKRSVELFMQTRKKVIVELGTTRSFLPKGSEGCMNPDHKYWQEHNPDSWDWGAGCFTRLCVEMIDGAGIEFHTVDPLEDAISISKKITATYSDNVKHHHTYSTDFLKAFNKQIDLLYMDHHETCEEGALLHLKDAELLIKENKLAEKCVILIDDVRDDRKLPFFVQVAKKIRSIARKEKLEDYGKGTYSIPFLLRNGFKLELDSYQFVLSRGF